ncbi:MAG: peptidoglycan DD-metalloendopeptidase family protein [Thermodesulfobacteriota bacterium]
MKLLNKDYIGRYISPKAARLKSFVLSPLFLQVAAAVLTIVLVVSSYLIYKYINVRKKLADLQHLRAEATFQREEMENFMQKIGFLEAQLAKLKEMEKQVENELKELKELRAKISPKIPAKNIKKNNQLIENKGKIISQDLSETRFLKERKTSLEEMEKEKLVQRLHDDIHSLQREISRQESNLKNIQRLLENQKTMLLATPSLWPVLGSITSTFGETRLSPAAGGVRPHKGVDISAPLGTPIVAAAEGIIVFAGWQAEMGKSIYLDHGHGFATMYGHLKTIMVKQGEKVKKGQIIGTVGMTGNSTGPHLHYEVHVQGIPVNPQVYLRQTS